MKYLLHYYFYTLLLSNELEINHEERKMKKDREQEIADGISLPQNFTSDLRGRQSVRATFKLTVGCIDAISIVATQLGIKQKSLFDHLIEDTRSLSLIAREIKNAKIQRQNRIQKTFVMSRRSLSFLDEVSRSYNAPRDALIEYTVQSLLPIIAKEQEKHSQRKETLGEIKDHFDAGKKLLNTVKSSLGAEDHIYQRLEAVMMGYENAYNSITSFIERSKIIEDFKPETLKDILLSSED